MRFWNGKGDGYASAIESYADLEYSLSGLHLFCSDDNGAVPDSFYNSGSLGVEAVLPAFDFARRASGSDFVLSAG